jgi:hypothetical protein
LAPVKPRSEPLDYSVFISSNDGIDFVDFLEKHPVEKAAVHSISSIHGPTFLILEREDNWS